MKRSTTLLAILIFLSSCSNFPELNEYYQKLIADNEKYDSLEELKPKDKKKSSQYVIQTGDTLSIDVWGEPKISSNYLVRNDGKITVPLINDVKAEGLTLSQLKYAVRRRLSSFIPQPSVTVGVSVQAPTKYFVDGNIAKRGDFRTTKPITLLQAITAAGGFAAFANKDKILLIRQDESSTKRYKLSYDKMLTGEQINPTIKDGDVVYIK